MAKEYKNLTFTDDFVFGKVLTTNPELCKELLELILCKKITDIKLSEPQKTIKQAYHSKGIRLDVYVEDEDTIYDIEMQTTFQKDLPKRTRYYQGIIDLNLIESGASYSELKESYIIFICTSDPFGKNLPVYTFKNVCVEDGTVVFTDSATKIILNATGDRTGLSQNMAAFLDFLQNQKVSDKFTDQLSSEVCRVKQNKDWSVEYMHISALLADTARENYNKGYDNGIEQGIEQGILKTINILFGMNVPSEQICVTISSQYGIDKNKATEYIAKAKQLNNN